MKNTGTSGSSSSSASGFIKNVMSMLSSIAKAKTMAIKSKTGALKARIEMFSLLKNKKIPHLGAISHKIQALLAGVGSGGHDEVEEDQSRAIALYNAPGPADESGYCYYDDDNDGYDNDSRKYPDLRHCLFEEEDQTDDDPNGSVIDLVKNSKEDGGENFKLEDEIDQVADLFILKFHKRMRMQKLASFKRYQEMLDRST